MSIDNDISMATNVIPSNVSWLIVRMLHSQIRNIPLMPRPPIALCQVAEQFFVPLFVAMVMVTVVGYWGVGLSGDLDFFVLLLC